MAAAMTGELEVLQLLLERGAAMDAVRPGTGAAAFHGACEHNRAGCAEALARAGCEVGIKDIHGMAGREVAELQGHVEVLARLLPPCWLSLLAGSDKLEPGRALELELAAVVQDGDGVALARLLAAGADPNALVAGRNPSGELFQATALCAATVRGHLEAVRLLLDAGADPDRVDAGGGTPLMAAARVGRLALLRLLLARDAAVDAVEPATGATAFIYTCLHNQSACAEALVRAGCDRGIKDKAGWTGGALAEAKGHAAVVARLRAVVAEQLRAVQAAWPVPEPEPAAMQSGDGRPMTGGRPCNAIVAGGGEPTDQLVMAAMKGDAAALSRLLATAADPNALVVAQNASSGLFFQTTALRAAAALGRVEVARLLLDGGADPSRAGGNGVTPLMAAAGEGHLEVLRLLLARGAAVDAVRPDNGGTAFHRACITNQVECAEALARAGCDAGIKNIEGQTG
jgi:ankyrin repeat protein